jgi:hypothetical protein
MTRIFLAAGVAALAITAPAASKPADKGGHGNAATEQHRGGGKATHQTRGGKRVAEQRSKAREKAVERRQKVSEQRFEARDKALEQRAKLDERAREARRDRIERVADRRREAIRDLRADRVRDRGFITLRDLDRRFDDRVAVGFGVGGCPPGLAKKPVACMPPGQAKQLLGARVNSLGDRIALRDLPKRLRYTYRDTPDYYYRYGDGYLYRVNRKDQLISALMPLFGLGFTAGQPFPMSYPGSFLPSAYQPFYPATPYADYRYANGYVYEVDPFTGRIRDVDPLLGYGYGYGQPMPLAYSAYNVPYQYRPYYYDTSDYYYRYAPGAIYQVDPSTSLITAVAALLSPNSLAIGQPLPMGYSAYNVPYAYRSNYYDTPNDWYRYSNGYIYRVDPATQLVTALVASVLT